jgi:chromosome segregation ATPase
MNNFDEVTGPDIISDGWSVIDEKYISRRPPKIAWGAGYKAMTDPEKIAYLEKLAYTMNHAASLVQDERNELNRLCEQKEKQLLQMSRNLQANNEMIQSEITKLNEQRQEYNSNIMALNRQLRELKNGNLD